MNRMNKLNHFTKFEYLKSIVKDGLRFTTKFDDWDDENDSTLVGIYKEITHNDNVGVLCFLNDDETIYHWTYYAKGDNKSACCIELKKDELLEEYLYHSLYRCQEMQYDVLKEVSFDNVDELLFTKRYPYRNEREYRIVSLNGGYLPVKEFIQKITLSPFLKDDEFERKKSELRSYGLNCEINHSTILKNNYWIYRAELLKEKDNSFLVDTRQLERLSIDDLKQIHDFLKQFDKGNELFGSNSNFFITRLVKNGTIIGLAYTRIVVSHDSTMINCLLSKECSVVCNDKYQNHIKILIKPKYNDTEMYDLILGSLTKGITLGSFYINVKGQDVELIESLNKIGFTKTCKTESEDCCIYCYSAPQNK